MNIRDLTLTPRRPDETPLLYGGRVLCFLIATECTAPLSIEDLQLADNAAMVAVAPRHLSTIALNNISRIRHLIARVLDVRRKGDGVAPAAPVTRADENTSGGYRVALPTPEPRTPAPASRALVAPEVNF